MKRRYDLGEQPPLGTIPPRMLAAVVRPGRFGPPRESLAVEEVDTPTVGPEQVLVWVMAAGVNYNMVWAGRGQPVDVTAARRREGNPEGLHIGGSDAAGIVWAVGERVTGTRVGDEVIVTGAQWDERATDIRLGADPTTSRTMRAWGYETSFGGLAQFALADEYQVHPKPATLGWADAGCFGVSAGTAYRQLFGWPPHQVRPGDPVLIWGGAGGLGSMAIQLTHRAGGTAIAVVSDPRRAEHCLKLGARAVIDRSRFSHWGRLPDTGDPAFRGWQLGVRAFQRAWWAALGERRDPRIVFEHPGQGTLPTSVACCEPGGMVVLCGATSGYNGDVDLRYLWMRQIRMQGSHVANTRQFRSVIELAGRGLLDVCRTQTFPLAEAGEAHQVLHDGTGLGNLAITVNAI
ncbi:crotonyl-CoA carboxylase/reductase [Longispora sp. NPDC051575]|uniref:crotonyl-CoA carboxylase/reductase n=1 Tax=Longispora sp. NPDC051575 TaxID=3154943 RepID=UPI0034188231